MRVFDGIQSALNPQGVDAAAIAEISWVLVWGALLIFLGVMAILAYSVLGRRESTSRLSPRLLIIGGGIVFPAVTLVALLVYSLARAAALHAPDPDALRIEVVGEQWWWRVRYAGFETANEIHIPVGRPVELHLRSADVIHSFWVPALAGKLDMIPGRTNVLRVRAERPGVFRGQCAEYCGGPHALMALYVVAVQPDEFSRWSERQRTAAKAENPLFVSRCGTCHTVRGTRAEGRLGPDLTHVGSRLSLAAGVLPNNAGAFGAWIASSQHLKPGNLMPAFALPGEELSALAAYLEGLK